MTTETRRPMTPAEFDAACRELRRRCPWLSETSGGRTEARNAAVGGKPGSKHVVGGHNSVGRDFSASTVKQLHDAAKVAVELGLWALVHDVGSGKHLHTQGLAPGRVPAWWIAKFATEKGTA